MRFVPEITDDGNSGLDIARSALEPIKQKFPDITYSDLWTLAGKISIQEMGVRRYHGDAVELIALTIDMSHPTAGYHSHTKMPTIFGKHSVEWGSMIEKPSCYWVHMVWEDVTRGSADGKENGPKTPLRSLTTSIRCC